MVESFRIGKVKRGGSDPWRAFFLLREFRNFQTRLHYNRRISVSHRHRLPKNGRIFDKNGHFIQIKHRIERDKSRKHLFDNFHG